MRESITITGGELRKIFRGTHERFRLVSDEVVGVDGYDVSMESVFVESTVGVEETKIQGCTGYAASYVMNGDSGSFCDEDEIDCYQVTLKSVTRLEWVWVLQEKSE